MNQGYYTQPSVSHDQIAFISDDDLWVVSRRGGIARRLTAHRGFVSSPCFSPDGKKIAYLSSELSAEPDIYLISAEGGEPTRMTWLGVGRLSGWRNNDHLYFTSGIEGYPRREQYLYELNTVTQDFKKVNLGPASYFHDAGKFQVLARNSGDPARWKRYQGGTAGVIWTKQAGSPFRRILKDINTNISKPEVVNGKIYFISDHEGVGNVYETDAAGKKVKRLTNHTEYYCRHLRSCSDALTYQCGAEIFIYDLVTGEEKRIDADCATNATQAAVRYENWNKYFNAAVLRPDAGELAVITRGQLFSLPPFSSAVREFSREGDVRYSVPCYNHDGSKLISAFTQGEFDEVLVVHDLKSGRRSEIFKHVKWGKVWKMKCSPKSDLIALANNRNEVYILDLKKNTVKAIEKNEFERPSDFDWSPDGRYLAYSSPHDSRRRGIHVYDTKHSKLHQLFHSVCHDFSPSFDPEGKYLYFLSVREFAPNYNETHFDLGFPFATRPYVVTLNAKTRSPFDIPLDNPKAAPAKDKGKKTKEKPVFVEIDFAGIDQRILPFNFDLGGYQRIYGVKGGVLFWKSKIEPSTSHPRNGATTYPALTLYKFEDAKEIGFQSSVSFVTVNAAKSHVLLMSDSKLRLLEAHVKPTDDKQIGKKDGWVDGARVRLRINPKQEWQQMYREAWVLQKEHFWRSDMSKINWQKIYDRYNYLLKKVKTRYEFSDLMWEMQGELGTSHCYEMMGDYERKSPNLTLGRLGAFFSFDAKSKSYRIERLLRGDSWQAQADSPLANVGVSLAVGDEIVGMNAFGFEKASDLYEMLENKANINVELTVKRQGSKTTEKIVVKTNSQLSGALYRDWVEANKKFVHEASNGKLGYVHIPDMGPFGYAEFYRNFIAESDREGLVVDVRFNGGGHVSQHILKILAQKVIGFDETRYQGIQKFPMYAPGVLVAIANEYSGSDGDIFPHSFKLMKLGKLIGKRTWGGIIGINGQYRLRDGTWVTQPEYSFWFKDNEWYVENHGVDPDIEVDITPEDYSRGRDPQLLKAVQEALRDLKQNPGLKFKPSYYPDLSIPTKLAKLKR